jgi:hypothetical protein
MWQTVDPEGRTVKLSEGRWLHILDRHRELEPHVEEILTAVEAPTHRMPGYAENEEWFFLEGAGPNRWLHVVVHYEEAHGRVTTAFGRARLPWWR